MPHCATLTKASRMLDPRGLFRQYLRAWALATIAADAGRTTAAVGTAEAGYIAATRSFDAPHMRFNIADSHVGALVLSGRIGDAADVVERVQQQAADLPRRHLQ